MATRGLAWICLSLLGLLASGAAKSTSVTKIETLATAMRARAMQGPQANAVRVRITANTWCAFAVLQTVNYIARATFQIRGIANSCPKAQPAQTGHKTPLKACVVSSAALLHSMGVIAHGLASAVRRCAQTASMDAACGAFIAIVATRVGLLTSSATAVTASCGLRVAQLPKDIEIIRRLQSTEARKWQLAECGLDASSAIMALGYLALKFDGATRNCPAVQGMALQQRVSTARCLIGATGVIFDIARFVVFLALGVEHCAPGDQTDAMCVAAATSLVVGTTAFINSGTQVYLNCQVGTEANAIVAGTSVLLNRRRLSSKDELIGALSKQVGFNRRLTLTKLIEELANESTFENAEDLWLSMGYNLSDPNAAWLEEDPEGTAVISKGRQMIKELQTTREEPPKELFESGPEEAPPMNVPEVLIDPQDDASTLGCSEKDIAYMLDLPGHAVSMEQGIAACQARCARAPGCAHFSYWPPQRHCHLHGILAEPLPGQPPWISGPPGCKEPQVSNATRRTVARKLTCYHPHAVYEPRGTLAEPRLTSSIEDCQRRCQQTKGCAHFVYSELDGECSLADVTAVKLQPVLYNIAGPRHCPDTALAFPGPAGGTSTMFEGQAGPIAFRSAGDVARGITGAVCAVSGAALVLWAGLAALRCTSRGIAETEPAMQSAPTIE